MEVRLADQCKVSIEGKITVHKGERLTVGPQVLIGGFFPEITVEWSGSIWIVDSAQTITRPPEEVTHKESK